VQATLRLLFESAGDEQRRLDEFRARLLASARIIPLTSAILVDAPEYARTHGLPEPDAIVYASVLRDRQEHREPAACFLNRNTRDFTNPDMLVRLAEVGCRLIPGFDGGLEFVRRSLARE
jgi:hypothetical protein